MNRDERDELVFDIARKITSESKESKFYIPWEYAEENARIALSAIESAGYYLCQEKPEQEAPTALVEAGFRAMLTAIANEGRDE